MDPQVVRNAALLPGARAAVLLQGILVIMDEGLLNYLAGCIDCDGSINVVTQTRTRADGTVAKTHTVRVTFVQVTEAVPRLFGETFGGNFYYYDGRPSGGWWQWYVAGANATRVIRALQPYLRLKTGQAAAAITLAEMITARGQLQGAARRLTDADVEERMRLVEEVRRHNVRRSHAKTRGRQHVTAPASGNS